MSTRRLTRVFWIGAAAILVAAALVALGAVVNGEFSNTDGRILITLGALLYTGGAALTGLALTDRARARVLGWTVVAAAPVCLAFAAWATWSWAIDGSGEDTADELAWSGVLLLLSGVIATTGLLLARRPALTRLAVVAGVLAAVAAMLSVIGIWSEPTGDGFVKLLSAMWIVAALCYVLVPVLQRFSAAGTAPGVIRVVAELEGVEVVAARQRVDGIAVAAPDPGETLYLRRTQPG